MARSFLAAIAEAAGLDEKYSSPGRATSVTMPAQPIAELSLPEQIVQTWKADPAIRDEFRSLSSYAAWRTNEAAKAAGVTVAQLNAEHPDVSGYLAKHEAKLAPGESMAIQGYAATWTASADIRAEFRTFEVYAAYMRAKSKGLVKHYGQGTVR